MIRRTIFFIVVLLLAAHHHVLGTEIDLRLPVIAGNTSFGVDFYQQFAGKAEQGNFVCSPYNAANALLMAYDGALGADARTNVIGIEIARGIVCP